MAKKVASRRTPGAGAGAGTSEHDDPAAVQAWLEAFDHPLKAVVEGVRKVILGVDPGVTEGIKWNSPSFWLGGWFATVNARGKQGVVVVLHLGAKAKTDASVRETMDDPAGLLTWHSADRASVTFADEAAFKAGRAGLQRVVAQWVAYQRESSG